MLHEPCAHISRPYKNSLFLSFRASFMGYSKLYLGPGSDFMLHEPYARLLRCRKNWLFCRFGQFLWRTVWGPELIFDAPRTLYTAIETSQKVGVFDVWGEFPRL